MTLSGVSRSRYGKPTQQQVERAAAELASQERHNPAWCKPADPHWRDHADLYRRRAQLILEAALRG